MCGIKDQAAYHQRIQFQHNIFILDSDCQPRQNDQQRKYLQASKKNVFQAGVPF